MHQLNAASYHEAIAKMERVFARIEGFESAQQTSLVTFAHSRQILRLLDEVGQSLQPLNVPITKLTLDDVRKAVADSHAHKVQQISIAQMLLNISENLRRELQAARVFTLDPMRAAFYAPSEPPMGDVVAAQFPSIAGELDHAGKCFACDLPTAAAFHWVRCLEAGVRAVCRCLGIADPTKGSQRNWSSIAREIAKAMEARWPDATAKETEEAKRFAKYLACLTVFTNPYRNETMHFDAVYTSAESLHLFELVKGLMQQISVRMDEEGQPALP